MDLQLLCCGYVSGPSIRNTTHQRLGQTTIYPMVNSTGETEFEAKKEEFISRGSNKQHLISLISDELQGVGCKVIQVGGDTDVDIAKTAVNIACVHSTTLIGEDIECYSITVWHNHSILDRTNSQEAFQKCTTSIG